MVVMAAKKLPVGLVAAVESGDRPAALKALSELLAGELVAGGDDKRSAPTAALAKELRATLIELAGVSVSTEVSAADELERRRAARGAKTANSVVAGRRSQPRRSNGSHRTG